MSSPKSDDNQTEGSANGEKIRVKFIFANRDGVNVEIECSPSDTVGMMKASLISQWPKDVDENAPKIDRIRLICMGKGILGPDNASIEQTELPVFLTHPTPINVSVKPIIVESKESRRGNTGDVPTSTALSGGESGGECCCVVS